MRSLGLLLLLVAPALPAPALAPEPGAPPALNWLPHPEGRSALTAVAVEMRSGRVAVGDARGVLAGPAATALAPVATRAPVRALVFTSDGVLHVGTEEGLFALEAPGVLTDRSPGPGDEARHIERLAAAPGLLAAATAAGIYVSSDGRRWQRLGGPRGALAVALRPREGGADLAGIASGEVYAAPVAIAGEGLAPGTLEPVPGLDPGLRAGAVDVQFDAGGALVVVSADRLARRPAGSTAFQVVRPSLPPGAALRRLAAAAGRLWLASDRGLLAADGLEGPFERTAPGLPATDVRDLAGDATRILAATESGLVEGVLAAPPDAATLREARLALEFPARPLAPESSHREEDATTAHPEEDATTAYREEDAATAYRREPPVEAVFRAALDYLDLRPELVRNLRRGLSVRGLLPDLVFRLERGRRSDGESSLDESFVSGDTRRLRDFRSGNDRETVASVTLAFELGDLAYDAEAVDLSREARAVIQLRDDVLDEISRLYFDRRRVLRELDSLGPAPPEDEAVRLRLRADELAAGLDAWTGGWFGREAPPLTP